MKIKTISFVAAVAVAAVFTGCEWTSSDGNPTWSGSYNEGGETVAEMNFSGTYRNDARGGCAVLTKDGSSSSSAPVISDGSSTSISLNVWKPNLDTVITLPSAPDVGTVVAYLTLQNGHQVSWTNDGNGNLSSNIESAGVGKVNGNTVTLSKNLGIGEINDKVTVVYTPKDTSSAPVVSGNGAVLAITVSQSGSNLKLHVSNGVTMSGAITTVSVYSNATSVTYSAQFSASSGSNSIVGTLDDRTGQNRLDATWTSGASIYDVNGFCGTTAGSASAE